MPKTNPNGKCVEKGVWTSLEHSAPSSTTLVFNPSVDGPMSLHMVGCSGDPSVRGPGLAVARGMASQILEPSAPAVSPSFLYLLGDIVYTPPGSEMKGKRWNTQFYAQFASYVDGAGPLPIFAVAGNHDGKIGNQLHTEIAHFEKNICGTSEVVSSDNRQPAPQRTVSTVPYRYWLLVTPLAFIVGLYTNVSNGGVLDDPTKYSDPSEGPQYRWLVEQLAFCKAQNAEGTPRAILLALHYPPYNGARDFKKRGNPKYGNDNGYPNAVPIGMVLQQAFTEAGQIPDAVFSAHAHLYQRMVLSYSDSEGKITRQVPFFIVGCGGHSPLELMGTKCGGGTATVPVVPFDLFTQGNPPDGLTAPPNGTVTIESYADGTDQANQPYGFLNLTLTPGTKTVNPTLVCQFYATTCDSSGNPVNPGAVVLTDSCTLDLATHLLTHATDNP